MTDPIQHFLTLDDFTPAQLAKLVDDTIASKPAYKANVGAAPLAGQTLALIFEKPSLRTRVSFEVAMTQLGGATTYLDQSTIGLGKREAIKDVARVLGRMCDGIMARTFSHNSLEILAEYSHVPVINGLTDHSHPCQAMADLVTIREHCGELPGKTLVFVGDGNNVARSLAIGCAKLGMNFKLICPAGYELEAELFERLGSDYPAVALSMSNDIADVAGADAIYTDTWISMGQEDEKARRIETFGPYQVNAELMQSAPGAIVLHCLPAYREMEITDEVFEAHAKVIMDEAENRLHFQRTLVAALLADGGIS
ncbi:MAG: ornithine carbamoyltransferase [Phycisphaerales bacterium]|jgi:ornithine carbamoyltransferase|nr:ornithine carbamoyltransferase [Phycisphaerales bacterium]